MLLHTDNLPAGYKLISEMNYLLFPNQKLFIISSVQELIFIKKKPSPYKHKENEPGLRIYQTEFPRAAAAWIVDTIENRLWRSAAEGGEPSGKNSVREQVAGETLTLRRVMAVGNDRDKGFILMNSSRPSVSFDEDYQDIQFSDRLLTEGGLLNVLRKL
ncbi:hypothetical protein [Rheinheimera sp. MMS21-TC3]|uniref:hypothetical protein n=1 Tax=Rheinheimera sp. MMS21-TC3 TaxID=3072790 RepID=UPI0028C4FC9E|nr:hypothetical protein [Rheinheimera sp. MMS21-TC3]WNO60361.1 hypothetical protein RDV63_05190 [Rheinheimera sp. MMS21-TC3]